MGTHRHAPPDCGFSPAQWAALKCARWSTGLDEGEVRDSRGQRKSQVPPHPQLCWGQHPGGVSGGGWGSWPWGCGHEVGVRPLGSRGTWQAGGPVAGREGSGTPNTGSPPNASAGSHRQRPLRFLPQDAGPGPGRAPQPPTLTAERKGPRGRMGRHLTFSRTRPAPLPPRCPRGPGGTFWLLTPGVTQLEVAGSSWEPC